MIEDYENFLLCCAINGFRFLLPFLSIFLLATGSKIIWCICDHFVSINLIFSPPIHFVYRAIECESAAKREICRVKSGRGLLCLHKFIKCTDKQKPLNDVTKLNTQWSLISVSSQIETKKTNWLKSIRHSFKHSHRQTIHERATDPVKTMSIYFRIVSNRFHFSLNYSQWNQKFSSRKRKDTTQSLLWYAHSQLLALFPNCF